MTSAASRAPASRTLADGVWEIIFMMLILKIPIVYLCCVVYWAIKSEPKPLEGATLPVALDPGPSGPRCTWRRRRIRPRPPRPSTGRAPARRAHAPLAR